MASSCINIYSVGLDQQHSFTYIEYSEQSTWRSWKKKEEKCEKWAAIINKSNDRLSLDVHERIKHFQTKGKNMGVSLYL